MINIIHGIIIDAFADLRDKQQAYEYDVDNVCFICSLEKWKFEKFGKNFDLHTKLKHNIWNYANFIVYLNVLGRDNANGTETYIMNKVFNRELNWIP